MAKKKTPTRSYTEIVEKIQALRAEATKAARDGMLLGFKEIFSAYPKLASVGWTQYSPHFNDGDECTFRANVDSYSIYLNGVNPDYGSDYSDEDEGEEELPAELFEEIADEVSEFLSGFEDEDFASLYGNHVRVTVRRDGKTDIDEYDHD
jgi:hypothetical protein